ncbi:hypothetical protein [Clostridium pasteurianum]|uniref:Uncharacterized protein n=1 Tax=Clostridium pasteurianum BC1 TaxID=86416 RepID=R4K7A2_CLOPA|nr:hypothetical protein [Clostridium pasteurianum]AGK97576.1 hypothetical protein Clopa_2731 [Clostridium pasteurianum BC1]
MVKQLILDVSISKNENIEELISSIIKVIKKRGNEVLTPNELILSQGVSEFYPDNESVSNKDQLEESLSNILRLKKEELKSLEEGSVDYLILKEEISEAQYILDDNCSAKTIEQVKYSTTSNNIYNLLSHITEEEYQ